MAMVCQDHPEEIYGGQEHADGIAQPAFHLYFDVATDTSYWRSDINDSGRVSAERNRHTLKQAAALVGQHPLVRFKQAKSDRPPLQDEILRDATRVGQLYRIAQSSLG